MPESDNLNIIPVGAKGPIGSIGPAGAKVDSPSPREPRTIMLARLGYAAYGATTDNKNYLGHPMPAFDVLPDPQFTAWRAAADALDSFIKSEGSIHRAVGEGSTNLEFGLVVTGIKLGWRAARKGWNGKNMFIYYVPANEYPAQTQVAKAEFGEMVPYGAYLALKTADGNVVPWLPSQTDILADDWTLFV